MFIYHQKYKEAFLQTDDIPAELQGRERIIFGNLSDILEFHKGTLIKELQECQSTPESLPSVFLQSVSKFFLVKVKNKISVKNY